MIALSEMDDGVVVSVTFVLGNFWFGFIEGVGRVVQFHDFVLDVATEPD